MATVIPQRDSTCMRISLRFSLSVLAAIFLDALIASIPPSTLIPAPVPDAIYHNRSKLVESTSFVVQYDSLLCSFATDAVIVPQPILDRNLHLVRPAWMCYWHPFLWHTWPVPFTEVQFDTDAGAIATGWPFRSRACYWQAEWPEDITGKNVQCRIKAIGIWTPQPLPPGRWEFLCGLRDPEFLKTHPAFIVVRPAWFGLTANVLLFTTGFFAFACWRARLGNKDVHSRSSSRLLDPS